MVAGTGGVVAFVGILVGACRGRRASASGPAVPAGDPRVAEVLRHSGWGVVLHTGAGLLLGAAIVAGGGVEGGVVAYQVGWVIFLAPYAVLAQPIHTAILPELVVEAREHGRVRVAASLRWALERMALLVVPVTAGMVALAAAGHAAGRRSARRAARARASWPRPSPAWRSACCPYSAFLLLARGYYALGDSRTPGRRVGGVRARGGVAVMVVGVGDGRRRGPHLRARPRPLGGLHGGRRGARRRS